MLKAYQCVNCRIDGDQLPRDGADVPAVQIWADLPAAYLQLTP